MLSLRVYVTAVFSVAFTHAMLPLFPPTWDMQHSTMVMPCNYSGMMDMKSVGKFGIVDIDWSNEKKIWSNAHPMNADELLVDQAKRRKAAVCPDSCPYPAGCPNKAACPQAKTWVYRNIVKAFSYFKSVREKLEDPAYAGFFLKFNPNNSTPYAVPQCDTNFSPPKCSDLYHDPEKTLQYGRECTEACDCGKVPCGKYIFDHRNGSMLTKWLLEEYLGSNVTGLSNPNIDGFFLDDIWKSRKGPSESGAHAIADMGLSASDMSAIQRGWRANMDAAKAKILNSSGFNWQMFDIGNRTNAGPPFKKENCTAYMRGTACKPDSVLQKQSMFYGFTDQTVNRSKLPYFDQDLASFLLIRGPYAWLGYSWVGCNTAPGADRNPIQYQFPKELGLDYGHPIDATCRETQPGSEVFTRKWSKATVTLDCKAWTSAIDRVADV